MGDLFIIPADYRTYAAERTLRLYVNGELRQQSSASHAIWGVDEIIAEARARQDTVWQEPGGPVSLFAATPGVVPARTMLLGGTPSGVIFNEVTTGQRAAGFFRWLFFGWGKSIPQHSIEQYIRSAHAAEIYLQPGDDVLVHIDGLGTIWTGIVQ